MSVFLKVLRTVCLVFLIFSCITIIALAILTTYNVIMRFFLGKPNSGVVEWSQMILIASMACLGYTFLDGRAIRVGVLVDTFPDKLNIAFEIFTGIVSFAFCILVGWRLFARIEIAMRFKEAYYVVGVPRWPMFAALGASFFSAALGTVSFVITKVLDIKTPKGKDIIRDNPELAFLALEEDAKEGSA